jgi:integrase
LHAAVHLALHLGLRRGELLGLRLEDVDVLAQRLTVARSFLVLPKSGRVRHLRLPAPTLPVLSPWLAEVPRGLGLIFPAITSRGPRQGAAFDLLGLPALLAAAGIRQLPHPWHALRHTFASHYMMAGGSLLALQRILGHAHVVETMRYAHLSDEYLGGEIDRLKY